MLPEIGQCVYYGCGGRLELAVVIAIVDAPTYQARVICFPLGHLHEPIYSAELADGCWTPLS